MRLTLRTLLAYLDDRLSPGNAREIGRKISNSPFAQELADRIRTVVRQRRLTAPDRRIKLIDPNQIAEYLDDQLTPELVSLIEKEILPSDFSLAEVAATHQILGLLTDPVELPDRLRGRLVAMNLSPAPESGEAESTTAPSPAANDSDAWTPLPPQGRISQRSPVLLLTILFAGLFALIATDSVFFPGGQDNEVTVADVDAEDKADEDVPPMPPGDEEAVAAAQGPGIDGAEPDGNSVVEGNNAPRDHTHNAEPPTDAAAGDPGEPVAADLPSEAAAAPAAAVAPDTPTKPNTPANPLVALPIDAVEHFTVYDPHGMLLARRFDADQWYPVSSLITNQSDWNRILTDSILAVPNPFRPSVIPDGAGWKTTLVSPALATFRGGIFQLFEGRCLITGESPDPESGGTFALMVGGTPIVVEFTDPKTRIGFDVFPVATERDPISVTEREDGLQDAAEDEAEAEDEGDDQQPSPPEDEASADREPPVVHELLPLTNAVIAAMYVADGDIQISVGGGEPIAVGKGRSFHWAAAAGSVGDLRLSDPNVAAAIPDWVYSADNPDVEEIESLKTKIAEAMKAADSPSDAAQVLSEDRNSQLAGYGASILSVTRQVDDMLVMLLSTSKDTVREEAIHGLRQVAAQTVYGEQQVVKVLETRLPMREIDDTLRLLYGLTPAQLEVEEMSIWLVMMLNSERPAIRQLAIMNLSDATGQTMGFHPDSDPGRRRESIRRWERHLKRNGNRLIVPQ